MKIKFLARALREERCPVRAHRRQDEENDGGCRAQVCRMHDLGLLVLWCVLHPPPYTPYTDPG
jgi:hypothetical protein